MKILLASLFLTLSPELSAACQKWSLDKLKKQAPVVVLGKVQAVSSSLHPLKKIKTHEVLIEVDQTLKGPNKTGNVVVELPHRRGRHNDFRKLPRTGENWVFGLKKITWDGGKLYGDRCGKGGRKVTVKKRSKFPKLISRK